MNGLFNWIWITLACLICQAQAASVLDFGAKGDGSTDDTQAIQQALDSARGPIELPSGTYLISETLHVRSNSGLIGSGTIYQKADKPIIMTPDSSTTESNIQLIGITLKKEFVENSKVRLVRLYHVTNLRIEGIEVIGGSLGNGIDLDFVHQFTVRDCYIHDFWGSSTDRDWNISGICIQHSSHGQVIGNRIENLTLTDHSIDTVGYQTDGMEIGNCLNVSFVGNVVRNVGEGLDLLVCESCAVTGNTFENCWNFGIKVIHGTHWSTITGNTILRAGLAGITVHFGNFAHGDIHGNVISTNTIVNTGGITRDQGVWKTWDKAGIELANCNMGPGNLVMRNLVANNVIIDNQPEPTCRYGINERHVNFPEGADEKGSRYRDLIESNLVSGNLVHGVQGAAHNTLKAAN